MKDCLMSSSSQAAKLSCNRGNLFSVTMALASIGWRRAKTPARSPETILLSIFMLIINCWSSHNTARQVIMEVVCIRPQCWARELAQHVNTSTPCLHAHIIDTPCRAKSLQIPVVLSSGKTAGSDSGGEGESIVNHIPGHVHIPRTGVSH